MLNQTFQKQEQITSFPQTRPDFEIEKINPYKYKDLTNSEYQKLRHKFKLEKFACRIEGCKLLPWASLVCNSCGTIIKSGVAKFSCLSPYCRDPFCIENRKRIATAYLKSLEIKSKNLLHTIIGFEHTGKFTKEVRDKHNLAFRLITREMKKLGTPLQMVVVRDLHGKKGDVYIHYHTANLPVKDWRKFRENLFRVREKLKLKRGINFSIKFKHYRKIEGLFKYFASRIAGDFGDIKNENNYGYASIMDIEEFYDCFYKTKKVKFIGISPRAKLSILATMLNVLITECPYCHSKDLVLMGNDRIEQLGLSFKPPPPPKPPEPLKITTEKIARHICGSCFGEFDGEDMQEKHLCKFCYNNSGSRKKINDFNKQFENVN